MNEVAELQTAPKAMLPYQGSWILDPAPVKVCEKSRRVGITWSEAADCALIASTKRPRGRDVFYVGYKEDIAREFIKDCAFWAKRLRKAASEVKEFIFKDKIGNAENEIKAFRIDFASGNQIVALSSRPSNLRGNDGIAVIDEAAFHPDLDELITAALAFRMWGGRVRIISTHNGVDNAFNTLVNDIRAGRKKYSLHRIDLDDAIAQGLCKVIFAKEDREWSLEAEAAWRQEMIDGYPERERANEELFCIPRAGGGVYLPTALIESCTHAEIPVLRWSAPDELVYRNEHERKSAANDWIEENLEPVLERLNKNLMSFYGEDFGRSGDLTVIWPVQLDVGLVRRTPFVVELRNVPFDQQQQILFYVADHLPRLCGGAMDARGNGQPLAEAAMQRYGTRIAQVMLTAEWYRDNMPRYKAAFEDRTFTLPKHPDILMDHRAFRMENGIAQIPANARTVGTDGNKRHGDSGIAGAMAYYASTMPKAEYAYTPAVAPAGRGFSNEDPAARDAYEDSKNSGGRGWMRERLRFGRGAW